MTRDMIKQTNQPFFSMRNGVFLPFVYKGHQVVVHNSSWTFRETVWVDDDLVFTGMGYSFKSVRDIEVAGDRLELTFGMRQWGTQYFLEVRHQGDLVVERATNPFTRESQFGGWVMILAGFTCGFLASYFADELFGLF